MKFQHNKAFQAYPAAKVKSTHSTLLTTTEASKISSPNHKKRAVSKTSNKQILVDQSDNITVATSTGQRPSAWLNILANDVSGLFLGLKKFNPVSIKITKSLKRTKFLWNLAPEIPAINAGKPLLLDGSGGAYQGSNKASLGFSPVTLESLNNGLFFANYAVNLSAHFFLRPLHCRKIKNCLKEVLKTFPVRHSERGARQSSEKAGFFLGGHGRSRVPGSSLARRVT